MDNKELPKEVVDKIKAAVAEKYWDVNEMAKAIMFSDGARMAQYHYAPIIEGKDKRIAELEAEVKKVMGLFENYFTQRIRDTWGSVGDCAPARLHALEKWEEYCKSNSLTYLGGE